VELINEKRDGKSTKGRKENYIRIFTYVNDVD